MVRARVWVRRREKGVGVEVDISFILRGVRIEGICGF